MISEDLLYKFMTKKYLIDVTEIIGWIKQCYYLFKIVIIR